MKLRLIQTPLRILIGTRKYYTSEQGARQLPAFSRKRSLGVLLMLVLLMSIPAWAHFRATLPVAEGVSEQGIVPMEELTFDHQQIDPLEQAGRLVGSADAAPLKDKAPYHEAKTVISTVFWVGEGAGPENDYIHNSASAWDGTWEQSYGGVDDPANRNGYHPKSFTPKENPFYIALPYNDATANGSRKASAANCLNNKGQVSSWCKNAWVKITAHGKTVYAQWEDVGPNEIDDTDYVFGDAGPKNQFGPKAGIDVSPAVRDGLGLKDVDRVSWSFVAADQVPDGPWKQIITTSPGYTFRK